MVQRGNVGGGAMEAVNEEEIREKEEGEQGMDLYASSPIRELDNSLIDKFRNKVNNGYVLQMYIENDNKNKWNIICSAMDWISVSIGGINIELLSKIPTNGLDMQKEQPPPPSVNTIFSTSYEASFLNWILFFICFGWIWMWFQGNGYR